MDYNEIDDEDKTKPIDSDTEEISTNIDDKEETDSNQDLEKDDLENINENIPSEVGPSPLDSEDEPTEEENQSFADGLMKRFSPLGLKNMMNKAGAGAATKTVVGKAAASAILPKVAIVSGIVLLAFIVIFAIVVLVNSKKYIAPRCTNMTITYPDSEEEDSIPVDQFVISMIHVITKDMKDANKSLYNALAITIRTTVQSGSTCNFLASDEVNVVFPFSILDKNSEDYKMIEEEIKPTNDLVMVIDKVYADASYDAFCYSDIVEGIDESYYVLAQKGIMIPYDWAKDNVDNERFLNCPCNNESAADDKDFCKLEQNYYGEDEEPKMLYVDGGHGEGLSAYGAYYFATVGEKNYLPILKIFFGEKIQLWSNNEKFNKTKKKTQCSSGEINMLTTPLSRMDFINLVNDYLADKNSKKANLFKSNAGAIYDKGKAIGANPEMIYIIAQKEGSWTGEFEGGSGCYNYYGYGITNGNSSGKCFSTFEDGYTTILEYVKKKGTLDEFTKVYSYLGTYLANPGSGGDGGCYYLLLDDIYGPNYSRCAKSYSCASSKGGSGCVETTAAEKQAYIDWQKKKILVHRESIFKISPDNNCVSSNGNYGGSSEGYTFLREKLDTFLLGQKTTLEAFNNSIFEQMCPFVGTGEGVAAVASALVKELGQYNLKFPYKYGGMHQDSPYGYYGAGANWGGHFGPDCSSFVNWALYNSGFGYYNNTATSWVSFTKSHGGTVTSLSNAASANIGDLIVTKSGSSYNHIVIVVGIDHSSRRYQVVHASSTSNGVIFSEISFDDTARELLLMSNVYNSLPKNQDFINNYCGG